MLLKRVHIISGMIAAACAGGCSVASAPQPVPATPPPQQETPTDALAGLTRTVTVSTSLPVSDAALAATQTLMNLGFDGLEHNGSRENINNFSKYHFSAEFGCIDLDGERMLLVFKRVKEGVTSIQFSSDLSEAKRQFVLSQIKSAIASTERNRAGIGQ